MAKKVVGSPISVQETRETLSVTVDVESGMTDFVILRKLINADDPDDVVSSQKIRETSPTAEVVSAIKEIAKKSADNQPEPAE